MTNEFAKNEKEIIDEYQKKGFKGNYRVENMKLIDSKTKIRYSPEDITILKEYRFEGMSNPSDMSILYILKTNDGSKGTVLANYSPSSNIETAEFFKEIPKDNYMTN